MCFCLGIGKKNTIYYYGRLQKEDLRGTSLYPNNKGGRTRRGYSR